MKLVDRYLLREMLLPLLATAATFVVLIVGHMLYTVVEIVVERGVPVPSVAKFLMLRIPGAAVMALPVSALIAVALVFNRLAGDGELTAVRAAGVSFLRLLLPCLILGAATAVVVGALNEGLAPRCEEASRRVLVEAVSQQRTLAFRPKRFLEISNEAAVYAEDVDPKSDRLVGVKLFLLRGDQPPILVTSPEAVFTEGALFVPRAQALVPERTGDLTWGSVGDVTINLSPEALWLPGGTGELRSKPLRQLFAEWRRLRSQNGQRAASYSLEIHNRIAVAAAAIAFALLAAPLTLVVGRGRSFSGLGASLVVVFAYYLAMLWTTLLGERGLLPPAAAAWLPNAAVVLMALWLVRRLR
ncbi:MAG: LptF/LptG family permease [Armatimonadetes bacterium]|nr:LptF/LptG family permease [Armatimonadota bacterium]